MLLDLVSNAAAFVSAMWIRFIGPGIPWDNLLYTTTFCLSILIYLVFSLYRRVHHEYSLTDLDLIENLSRVVRERIIQYIILVLLLFLARTIDEISRIMLAAAFLLDMLFSYLCRMIFRHFLLKSRESCTADEHYVIVTTEDQRTAAMGRLMEILPEHADCVETILIPQCGSERELDQLLQETELPEKAHIFVYLRGPQGDERSEQTVRFYRNRCIPVSVRQFRQGEELPRSMVDREASYTTIRYDALNDYGEVFGVRFAPMDVETASYTVLDMIQHPDRPSDGTAGNLSGKYLCFSNVHTTVMAHNSEEYRNVLNGSALTFADGKPIAERLRGTGFANSGRVAGPDFMDAVFRSTMDGRVTHYFYGSTPETIEKLGDSLPKRYPGIQIVGMVSPPFRPETPEEDRDSINAINASGASLIWIGLGAPKQEKWMASHKGQLGGVMLGVGAGFDFYAGTIKRAPKWIQKIGFEWLYRLFQDPKRLANRYIVTNAQFLWYSLTDWLRR